MFIVCELCYSSKKWTAENHDEYLDHLLSQEHQEQAMEKISVAWENSTFQEIFDVVDESRCIVVRGSYPLNDLKAQKDVVETFQEFGIIHDFVLLKSQPKFICAVIFDSSMDVRNVMLKFQKSINGQEVSYAPWSNDNWVLLKTEIQSVEKVQRVFPSMTSHHQSIPTTFRPLMGPPGPGGLVRNNARSSGITL